jgi:hypothetical protein
MMGDDVAAVVVAFEVAGRWALYVPAALLGWLSIELLADRFPCRGVARKRREHNQPESGVPTLVSSPSERHLTMTITIGIDPHKGSHTAVAIDSNEHVLDEIGVRSCATQTVRLRDWAQRFEE